MNSHIEAWNHVKPQLFGKVCEVARRVPWGFIKDDPTIINVTVGQFLNSDDRYDTILLHILSGEGERKENVLKVIWSAWGRCIKLVILEHNHLSGDFTKIVDTKYILDALKGEVIYDDWGRNILYACTTFKYLQLPQLNDKYYADNINLSYIGKRDHGIDTDLLVYTHTSEDRIDFPLPEGLIHWVIGGGIAYESMKETNYNVLFDSVLRQVLLCAHYYEPGWKVDRLFDFSSLKVRDWKGWRVPERNGVYPNEIYHFPLKELQSEATVYVSTVHKSHWEHLTGNIIEAWTERDHIQLK